MAPGPSVDRLLDPRGFRSAGIGEEQVTGRRMDLRHELTGIRIAVLRHGDLFGDRSDRIQHKRKIGLVHLEVLDGDAVAAPARQPFPTAMPWIADEERTGPGGPEPWERVGVDHALCGHGSKNAEIEA